MAPSPVPTIAIVCANLTPPMSSEGLVSVTRKHIWPIIIEKATEQASKRFNGPEMANAQASISVFRTGENSTPGAGVAYSRNQSLGQKIRRQVYNSVFTKAVKEALTACFPRKITEVGVDLEAKLSLERVEKYTCAAGRHILPIQEACCSSFLAAIPYAVYAVVLTALVCNYGTQTRIEDLQKNQLFDAIGDFASIGYSPSDQDVKELHSGLLILLECFAVVTHGNAIHASQREKIEDDVRLALLQLNGCSEDEQEFIVQYHDAAEAENLLSALSEIKYEAKRDLSDRMERDSDAYAAAIAANNSSARHRLLKEKIECMYYVDEDDTAHWAGLSHAFYIHGTPVVLAMVDAVDKARADMEFIDSLHSLKSDVSGRSVTRRTLGQLGQTYASILRLVLLAQHECAVIYKHVDIKYVVDEIFRRVDEQGHLRSRKTNREVVSREETQVPDDQPEGWQ